MSRRDGESDGTSTRDLRRVAPLPRAHRRASPMESPSMNIQNFVLIDAPRTTIAGHTIIAPFHAQVYRVTIRNCCLIRYKDGELRAWSPSAFGRGEPAAVFKNPFRRKLFDEAGECFVPPHGTRRPNRMASFQTTKTDPPREPVVDAPSFLATVARHGRRPLRGMAGDRCAAWQATVARPGRLGFHPHPGQALCRSNSGRPLAASP